MILRILHKNIKFNWKNIVIIIGIFSYAIVVMTFKAKHIEYLKWNIIQKWNINQIEHIS